MTPTPPPPPPDGDSPLSARHRPSLDELGKTTTESELWELDDDLDTEGPAPDDPHRPQGGALPEPRQRRVADQSGTAPAQGEAGPAAGREQIRMNVGKQRPAAAGSGGQVEIARPGDDFDDLEWDDDVGEAGTGELPPASAIDPEPVATGQPEPPRESRATQSAAVEPPAGDGDGRVTPERHQAKPVPLRPRLGLSGVERIGMTVLAAVLLLGGVYFYVFSVKRLPAESLRVETTDFPIKGSRIAVNSADTYWRAPVTEGPDADTFRRGTRLLPEIEMAVAGRGALRVLFRNEERQFVGDAVTRTVGGASTLRIPATAGFDDSGMHAAYRTGGTRPWTASVYEGESENSPGSEFELLFEMNISTDRR